VLRRDNQLRAPATTISIFSIEILRLQLTDSLPTLLRVGTGAACSPSRGELPLSHGIAKSLKLSVTRRLDALLARGDQ
jgi:hypothetical protein